MQLLHVVGARLNFMKAALVIAALSKRSMAQTLFDTGQHYDANISEIFFEQRPRAPAAPPALPPRTGRRVAEIRAGHQRGERHEADQGQCQLHGNPATDGQHEPAQHRS